jgi:hypothetical protein
MWAAEEGRWHRNTVRLDGQSATLKRSFASFGNGKGRTDLSWRSLKPPPIPSRFSPCNKTHSRLRMRRIR